MKKLLKSITNADQLGIISSALCLIHCLLTPVFVGSVLITDHAADQYHYLNYFFLVLSLVAVWTSTRKQSNLTIRTLLWLFFVVFSITLLTEQSSVVSRYIMYAASIGLVVTHYFSLRECQSCEA